MHNKPISILGFYWRSRQLLLWGLLIAALVVGACSFSAAFFGDKADQLSSDGIETVATFIKASNYDGTTNSMRAGETVRKADVTFTYQTQDQLTVEKEEHWPIIGRDAVVGDTFPVWYSASSPEIYERSVGHQERNSGALVWLGAVFGVLLAGSVMLMPFIEARGLLKIRDNGTQMTVIVREPARQDIEKGFGEHLHWQVKGSQPASSRFPVDAVQRPKPGDTITVFQYDDQSVWEGEFGPQKKA